jgi:hypothetical protein
MDLSRLTALAALALVSSVMAFPDRVWGARIFTIAGTGEELSTQEGGIATEIPLAGIQSVAAADNGDILIATSQLVWRLSHDGKMQVVAGTLVGGTDAEGVPATQADLHRVADVAATHDGGFLISDAVADRVRKVDATGVITTVAGTGEDANTGDGGPAVRAGVDLPDGLAVLPDGGFLVSVDSYLRRVGPDGMITTVAGTGELGARWRRWSGASSRALPPRPARSPL